MKKEESRRPRSILGGHLEGPSIVGASEHFLLGHDPLVPPGLSPSGSETETPGNKPIFIHTLGSCCHHHPPVSRAGQWDEGQNIQIASKLKPGLLRTWLRCKVTHSCLSQAHRPPHCQSQSADFSPLFSFLFLPLPTHPPGTRSCHLWLNIL